MSEEQYVIKGPDDLKSLPKQSLGEFLFHTLIDKKSTNKSMMNVSNGESMSYGTLLLQTCKIASAFKNFGLQRNDVISICSENNLYFFQPIIAALYLGIITAPINVNHTPREILHAISITKPKIIFCSLQSVGNVLKSRSDAPYVQKIIVFGTNEAIEETESLNNFIDKYSENSTIVNDDIILKNIDVEEQVAVILYSSGTTGLPKGVMMTHKNIQTALLQMNDPRILTTSDNDYVLSFLPLFHIFGLILGLLYITGFKKILILPKFDVNRYCEIIQNYKINNMYTPPTIITRLATTNLTEKYDLSHIKDVVSSSASLSQETEELFKKKLPGAVIRQSYGLTEATMAFMVMPLNDHKVGSVGKIMPGMSVKVLNITTGKSLGPHENGEICAKGPMVTKGYFGNDAATAAQFDEDGWLHTGDVGHYDEDEYFYIVDRIKELIKYKSFQVSPAELEKVLLTHPNISDAGVVGIPDEVAGELPLALVVKNSDVDLTEKEVQNFVAGQVSPEKRLRGGVIFVDELPRSSLGKIMRLQLREIAREKYGRNN